MVSRFDDDQPTLPLTEQATTQHMAYDPTYGIPLEETPPAGMPVDRSGSSVQSGQGGLPPSPSSIDQLYYQQMPPPPAARRPRWVLGCLGCAIVLGAMALVTTCGLTVGGIVLWNSLSQQNTSRIQAVFGDDSTSSTGAPVFQTTFIYDRNGNELHQLFGEGRRTRVKLSEIAPALLNATIAVEDSTFYENTGFDLTAIGRALFNYLRRREAGGASTITQQLVRNVVFDAQYRTERSPRRKLEEVLLATVLTQQKTKDEILELYLNTIYYGNLAYGVEAAARTYFNKGAKDLTLSEAALLAGLPQSPANYDPLNPDPDVQDAVLTRRNIVLNLMVDKGKITEAQAREARGQALVFANPNVNLKSPHFTLYAESELKSLLEAINLPTTYLNTAGLLVYTSLDANVQTLVEKTARDQIAQIKARNNANNAAVVVLKPATGEILAMLGSVDYRDDRIDGRVNVAISPRQPGSSIKPLTYAAAIERGISPAAIFWDVETRIDDGAGNEYAPLNYDRAFHGAVRMRDALANSYNIPAVKALRLVGVDYLLQFAQRLGIQSLGTDSSQYGLSLTLGGGELTPLELTQAYAVFANEGKLVPATTILCIVDNSRVAIWQYRDGCAGRGTVNERTITATPPERQVLDPRIAYIIRQFLNDNAARSPAMGGNSPLRTDGIFSSVKTGTTNNYRDNWTVGITRNVAIGVWVGNTDNTEMKGTTGLTGAAPIWNGVLTGIYGNADLLDAFKIDGALLTDEPTQPEGITTAPTCPIASMRDPLVSCDLRRREYVLSSPALTPDENGDLRAGQAPLPTPVASNGPILSQYQSDPGLIQALVAPINPALAASMVVTAPGQVGPPPPNYCLVPADSTGSIPFATTQLFIAAPVFEDEDPYARIYAQGAGVPILPRLLCSAEIVSNSTVGLGLTAQINAPAMGETVTGTVTVLGTAAWGPNEAWYYKTEIKGASFPEWTTFGNSSETPVVNGVLGNFGATGLAPGLYELRIVIVGRDGNYLTTSFVQPINITGQ